MRSATRFPVAVTALLLAVSGCKVMHNEETAGQYVDDATLLARAKAALLTDKEVNSNDFTVEVYQGRVTVSGVAKNAQESKRVEDDIRRIPGVKSVENDARLAEAESSSTPR